MMKKVLSRDLLKEGKKKQESRTLEAGGAPYFPLKAITTSILFYKMRLNMTFYVCVLYYLCFI